MAEPQPPALVEGATTGDVEDEIADVPKAAEDRKAAAALSSLDAREDEAGATKNVDQDAVKAAMSRLGGGAEKAANTEAPKEVKKAIKVNPADVALLVCSSSHSMTYTDAKNLCSGGPA